MNLVYFAWIRVKMGVSSEHIDPPKRIKDIEGLIHWIKQRNPVSNEAFSEISNIRFAVNQEYVKDATELYDGDEVVLIPPVQGG